jgi:hypothetical protein
MDDRSREAATMADVGSRDRSREGRIRRSYRTALFLPAALALTMVGPTAPDSSGQDARPVLTSFGITREDGTPSGVIGGRERFRLQAPPGKAFREIVWEIAGAIASQEVSSDRGFVNTPLPNPLVVRPPEDATESIVDFYWNGAGGEHSIRVTAFYTDGTVGTPEGFSPQTKD